MNHDNWKFQYFEPKYWIVDGERIKYQVAYSKIPGRKTLKGIGVDPGRNFGIACLHNREAWILSARFPKRDRQWKYGVLAYELMINPRRYHGVGNAIVEGAAFKSEYGQAGLAHIRMGFLLGLHTAGYDVSLAAPASIRAAALGSGKIGGLEVWPDLNHNAADALAAALYASGRLKKEDIEGSHLEK